MRYNINSVAPYLGGPWKELGGPRRERGGLRRKLGGSQKERGGLRRKLGGPRNELEEPKTHLNGPPRQRREGNDGAFSYVSWCYSYCTQPGSCPVPNNQARIRSAA